MKIRLAAVLALGTIFLVGGIACSAANQPSQGSSAGVSAQAVGTQTPPQPATEKDLVCGMTVDPTKALSEKYKDKTYYFCSETCLKKFKADPEKYIKAESEKKE